MSICGRTTAQCGSPIDNFGRALMSANGNGIDMSGGGG